MILISGYTFSQTSINLNKPNNFATLTAENIVITGALTLTGVLTTTTPDFALTIENDTVKQTAIVQLDSITGNIANSVTSLDTLFSTDIPIIFRALLSLLT